MQMMELALRHRDPGREWLASFDKCITQDLGYSNNKPLSGSPAVVAGIDSRIVHLPGLWKKYHDHGEESFWVSMIREATQKRLRVSRREIHLRYDSAKSGWHKEIIEEQLKIGMKMSLWMIDLMANGWVVGNIGRNSLYCKLHMYRYSIPP
jgi:hypothetical protein